MKKVLRSLNLAVLLTAILVVGAVANFAQDPCTDAAGMSDLDAKVRAAWADKTLGGRKNFVNTGKQFLEKYGACDSQKEFVDWLKIKVPDTETKTIPEMEQGAAKTALVNRFNTALGSKNWDEVYSAGKEILAKYPDEYRDVELVLGTIGYDEFYNNKNAKYNDDTIKYAKMALADIDAGKFKNYGIPKTAYHYKTDAEPNGSRTEATGWMNFIIGYLTQNGLKNKQEAQPYIYKATQVNATTGKNPIPYELIGLYYFDELNKITKEVTALADSQKETDTPEVAKQKVDDIKSKVALANGYAERAMDAFARAYNLGTVKAYKDLMYKNLQDAFKVRYGKIDQLTPAWIAEAVKKPLPNPTSPVAPISDEPANTTAAGGVGAATGTGVGSANGNGVGAASGTGVGNPAAATPATTPVKAQAPAGAPAKPPTKRQATVKRTSGKKSA